MNIDTALAKLEALLKQNNSLQLVLDPIKIVSTDRNYFKYTLKITSLTVNYIVNVSFHTFFDKIISCYVVAVVDKGFNILLPNINLWTNHINPTPSLSE